MKVNADDLNCTLLLGLLLIYLSQPILGLSGIVGPPILILIFILSAWYLVKFWVGNERKDYVAWVWLVFLLYAFLLYLVSGKAQDYSEMRHLLLNFLPFFAFYYFTRKGVLTERTVKAFFFSLLVVFILNMQVSNHALAVETGRDEFANNASYHIMGLLPFVFLLRKKVLVGLLILLLIWFAVGSMKRAVLIVSMFSAGLFAYSYFYTDKSVFKIKGVAIGLAIFSVLVFLGLYYYYNIGLGERFEERIMLMIYERHSAGRDVLIQDLFNAWHASDNALTYLFGLGYSASEAISTNVTHNDFIKSLGESGLFGLIMFVSLFLGLMFKMFSAGWTDEHKLSYIMIVAVMVMASLTSRWYGSSFFYMNCVLLPYLLASRAKTPCNNRT